MTYNQIAVPVADAGFPPAPAPRSEAPRATLPEMVRRQPERLAFGLLAAWTLVHFTAFGFLEGLDAFVRVLQIARYLLWPAIFAALFVHLGRSGGGRLARALGPIAPYFAIGVVSGIIGFDPFQSARLLFFWGVGTLAAAIAGLETSPRTLRRIFFFLFVGMLAASVLFALVKPDIALSADTRVASGYSWRGLFPGKNLFGLISTYGVLFSICVTGVSRIVKLGGLLISLVTLYFAHSQGAVAAVGGVIGYLVLVHLLRRLRLSPAARAAILAITIVFTVAIVVVGYTTLSAALGRDASLTGRTEVWPIWLARAMEAWATGYGPGSFTGLSFITVDLTAAEVGLGSIHTPHNMFIAIFGEVGLFGIIAYLAAMLYFAFLLPFVRPTNAAFFAAATAFTTLVSGISETREVFGLGMNMFLVIASYANALRPDAAADAEAGAAPDEPHPPEPQTRTAGIVALGS